MWTCEYCYTVNKQELVRCCECGASVKSSVKNDRKVFYVDVGKLNYEDAHNIIYGIGLLLNLRKENGS